MKKFFLNERKNEIHGLLDILSRSRTKDEFFVKVKEEEGFKSLSFFMKTLKAFNTPIDVKNFILLSLPGLISWFVAFVFTIVSVTNFFISDHLNLWFLSFATALLFTGRNCLAETNNFYIWFRPFKNFTLDNFRFYLLKENGIIEKETILESVKTSASKDDTTPKRKRI